LSTADDFRLRAAALDTADPLGSFPARFVRTGDVRAYFDGNSLGRPVAAVADRLAEFTRGAWGERLIRAWDEEWMDTPTALGDELGRVVLGAAPGQTFVGDSTTVLIYKLVRAAVDAAPAGRDELVVDTENFPTDRFIVESIAAERGLTVRWIAPDPALGVTVDDVRAVVGERTALVVLSHIAFKSAYIADLPAITALVHDAGARILWDLCHSAGAVRIDLDAHGVDFAVGCTYKYLNGGPGAPAFAYVASSIQDELRQPIPGWMGAANPFEMGPRYEPGAGIRRFISGTPSILAMIPMRAMIELIDEAGIDQIRAKSIQLTEYAIEFADDILAPHGVTVASPRDPAIRGSHVILEHPEMQRVTAELWAEGIIPDFRRPQGLRIGLSPLSTTYAELADGLVAVEAALTRG